MSCYLVCDFAVCQREANDFEADLYSLSLFKTSVEYLIFLLKFISSSVFFID